MKTPLKYGVLLLIFATATAVLWAANEKPDQAIRVTTESKEEVNKLLASLEGIDKSSYRVTVVETLANGKTKTKTYGAAPLDAVRKIGGGKVTAGGPGITKASDIIIIVKNITKSGIAQDRVLKSLDTKLSRIDKVNASKVQVKPN